jgi:polygalacturonase
MCRDDPYFVPRYPASLDMMAVVALLAAATSAAAAAAPGSTGSLDPSSSSTRGCSVADFGAVADNKTDGTKAFRAAAKSGCPEILVPPGVWMT